MTNEIIMEDNDIVVIMPQNAISKGHIIVVPKQKYIILEQIPDPLLQKMFQVSNKLSSVLFDTMQCQGTNILIQNGIAAGQKNSQFSINIIPRFDNDKINFEWKPKQVAETDLVEFQKRMDDTNTAENAEKYLEDKKNELKEKKDVEITPDEDNYLIKSLTRTG